MTTDTDIVERLRQLAQCADIPMRRRRQLLQLLQELEPSAWPQIKTRDYFADGYYRRAGLRMRLPRGSEEPAVASAIRALVKP